MRITSKFLWGGSVSAHQTEGATDAIYKKGKSIYDELVNEGFGDFSEGIDTYNRYKEDIALFKEMGMNSYRISISWSRLFPEGEGEVNELAVDFYNRYIDELIANDIEPIICLYHFDTPLSIHHEYSSWLRRETVTYFVDYAEYVIKMFKDKVKFWLPMNEQNGCPIVTMVSLGIRSDDKDFNRMKHQIIHNLAVAGAHVHRLVKEHVPGGISLGMVVASPVYPKTSMPLDVLVSQRTNETYNHILLKLLTTGAYPKSFYRKMENEKSLPNIEVGDMELLRENTIQNIGISYYGSLMVSNADHEIEPSRNMVDVFKGEKTAYEPNPYLERTEWNWIVDHDGLRIILSDIYSRYELPIYVLESGIGVIESLDEHGEVNDDYRIDYMRQQIQAVKDAMHLDGVDVRSFLTWAPIDILSSQGEMKKRYGFIYVNRKDKEILDMKRYKKKSFEWFKNVIASNGTKL